jgi:hypothetical protein
MIQERDRGGNMQSTRERAIMIAALVGALMLSTGLFQAADPLPSCNDTAPKQAIVKFVKKVTEKGSPDFVLRELRIATCDNDGTLWAKREWAYDRDSHIGKLDMGLDEAAAKGWTIVDMKKDWNRIHP